MPAALRHPNVLEGAMNRHCGWLAGLSLGACCLLSSCLGGKETSNYEIRMDGNTEHGKELIQTYGCGYCHIIPGLHAAQGMVGPPLMFFSRRTMIAGELPNSPENLIRWIRDPKAVEPGTAMPTLGLTEYEAHDVAAYLYTLR
jgi:cytochrome c